MRAYNLHLKIPTQQFHAQRPMPTQNTHGRRDERIGTINGGRSAPDEGLKVVWLKNFDVPCPRGDEHDLSPLSYGAHRCIAALSQTIDSVVIERTASVRF